MSGEILADVQMNSFCNQADVDDDVGLEVNRFSSMADFHGQWASKINASLVEGQRRQSSDAR